MELSKEKLEIYEKNLQSLQEATDELMRHMKGYDYSFRREITDRKGEFCPEKLRGLVEEMLSLWEEKPRANLYVKESWVKSGLRTRRELYGLYLYLVMRCSLCQGGYFYARGSAQKERTDFAFLLEQAKRLSRDWCVMAGRDGTCRNELYYGFDAHFGFHLYYALRDPDVRSGSVCSGNDWSLTPDWSRACQHDEQMTDAGNMKRLYLKHSGFRRGRAAAKEALKIEEEEETEELPPPEEDDSEEDGYAVWDPEEDDDDWFYPFPSEEAYREFQEADWNRRSEEFVRAQGLTLLAIRFQGAEEYLSACERFAELFETAKPEVLRDFPGDLEEIVDLYLSQRGTAPLADTDKALEVYGRFIDGPLRQARRYGRGIQWDDL